MAKHEEYGASEPRELDLREDAEGISIDLEPAASLVDAQARGGPTAIRGFDFQRRYALILLLQSLPDPACVRRAVRAGSWCP